MGKGKKEKQTHRHEQEEAKHPRERDIELMRTDVIFYYLILIKLTIVYIVTIFHIISFIISFFRKEARRKRENPRIPLYKKSKL